MMACGVDRGVRPLLWLLALCCILGTPCSPLRTSSASAQSGAASVRVLEPDPNGVDDQRNSFVPTSGSLVVGAFAGDPRAAYDRDSVFACLPDVLPSGADLYVALASVDGILEAHYRFPHANLGHGGLVRLDLKGKNLGSADFTAYREAEVATSVYLAASETDHRHWLVAQFSAADGKGQAFLQLNGDPAASTLYGANAEPGTCSEVDAASGRPAQTLMFNGICSFPPGASGPFRLVRRAARSTMEDLDLRSCASR